MFKDYRDARLSVNRGLSRRDLTLIRRAFEAYPSLAQDADGDAGTPWVIVTAQRGDKDILEFLIDNGCDINATADRGAITALSVSVSLGDKSLVPYLLERGADVNPSKARPLLSAINSGEKRLEMIKLLVEHGADVNRVYDLYGNPEILFTAVEFGAEYPEVVEYLKSKGAKTVAELQADGKLPPATEDEPVDVTELTLPEQTVKWFHDNIGPVSKAALTEIVPSELPITIHVVPATNDRPYVTLFTSGMSAEPMLVPEGDEDFEYAELFIQLPKDWKYKDLQNPKWNWPILWLRKMARYPHDNQTWLGRGSTIIAEEEPPIAIAPGLPFTSILLLAEHEIAATEGAQIRLYRVTPIHTDERELEIRSGLPALMQAFDRASISFVIDVNRKSVATPR